MKLDVSVPFDAASDDESFWDECPNRPAVFALFPKSGSGAAARPYLSRTTDLRRRMMRLLAKSPEGPALSGSSGQQMADTGLLSSRPSRPANFREIASRI